MLVFNHSASIRAPSRGGSRDGYEEQLCEATCSSESGEGRRPCGQLTLTTGGGAARLGAVTGEAEEPGHHARGPLPGEVSALALGSVARAGKTTSASGEGQCSGMRCRLGEGGQGEVTMSAATLTRRRSPLPWGADEISLEMPPLRATRWGHSCANTEIVGFAAAVVRLLLCSPSFPRGTFYI